MLLSIIPESSSPGATLFTFALECILILWVFKIKERPHSLSGKKQVIAILLCLLFYLFYMVSGDYFSYKEIVESAGFTNLAFYNVVDFHIELAYVAIINFVNNNYILFRLVVWGGALLIFCITGAYLKLDRSTFIFYLCIFIVPLSATSRVTLAYAVAYLGYAFIVCPFAKGKFISYAIGFLLVFYSLWLHRSAPFLLAVFPLSLIRFNKKTISILLISVPIIILVTQTGLIDYIFSMETTAEDSLFDAQTAQGYLASDKKFSNKGLGELIRLFLEYWCFGTITYLYLKMIFNGKYKELPAEIQKYMNAVIAIVVFSVAFLVMPGANTYKTFERLIAFAIVPAAFSLSYLLKNEIDSKGVRLVNITILSWIVYNALYITYLGVLH